MKRKDPNEARRKAEKDAAQRTLNGIDFDAMRRRIRDKLNAHNAKCKGRWT